MAGSPPCTAGGCPHLHDDGLEEMKRYDIASDAVHGDAAPDAKGIATQDQEVSGE